MADQELNPDVDWAMIEAELANIDDHWKQPRFDSLPHVVNVLTKRNPQEALEELRLQRDATESLVDEVVQGYYNGFTRAIHNYSQILRLFGESASKMSGLKKNLAEAQRLLGSRQKQLHNLWYRSITMRHVLSLIDQIDNVAKVPGKIEELIASKQLYSAVQLLLHSLTMLEREGIHGVGALRDVRIELAKLRGVLFFKVVDELQAHLYNKGDYSPKSGTFMEVDDDISNIVVVPVPALASPHPAMATGASAPVVPKKFRARSMRRSTSEMRGLSIETAREAALAEADEDPPTPGSEVSGTSSTQVAGAGSSQVDLVAVKRVAPSLPPWLKEARINDFTEMMLRNEAPQAVKYMQTMVECLALLNKVSAAGAILTQKLRSSIRDIIMSEMRARAAAAEAARPRMDQVTRTSTAAGTPVALSTQVAGSSPAKTPGKKTPQKGTPSGKLPNPALASAPPSGPMGAAQIAAQELLDAVMDTLANILENHVVASTIMEHKMADMASAGGTGEAVLGGSANIPTFSEATGGYSVAVAWACMQSECQQLVCDILRAAPDGSSADAATARLSTMRLIEDDSSSEGLSFSFRFAESALSQQGGGEGVNGALGGDGLFHVRSRKADPEEGYGTATVLPERGIYLTSACYRPVLQFTEKVCSLLPPAYADLGKHGLRPFIDSFVRDQFLPSIQADYRSRLTDALSGPSAFRPRGHGVVGEKSGVEPRPVLQGPMAVEGLVAEVLAWAQTMPVYAQDLVALVHVLLERTLERCRAALTEAVLGSLGSTVVARPEMEHLLRQQTASVLLDDKELSPADLKAAREDPPRGTDGYEVDMELYSELFSFEPIEEKQIISDSSKLVLLAALSNTMTHLANAVYTLGQGSGHLAAPQRKRLNLSSDGQRQAGSGGALTGGLARLSERFRNLSRDCLRTLRTELQLQCLFHLQAMVDRSYTLSMDPEEPEDFIVALTSKMMRLDEEIEVFLADAKRSYVFGGVCTLAATALVRALEKMVRSGQSINSLGVRQVQRNCIALQQTLTTLGANSKSSVQQSLDRVGEYYELLNRPYEALMAYVRDHDSFSFDEYAMLLKADVPGRVVAPDALEKLRRILTL